MKAALARRLVPAAPGMGRVGSGTRVNGRRKPGQRDDEMVSRQPSCWVVDGRKR